MNRPPNNPHGDFLKRIRHNEEAGAVLKKRKEEEEAAKKATPIRDEIPLITPSSAGTGDTTNKRTPLLISAFIILLLGIVVIVMITRGISGKSSPAESDSIAPDTSVSPN